MKCIKCIIILTCKVDLIGLTGTAVGGVVWGGGAWWGGGAGDRSTPGIIS